jgi:hypothetical protein
LPHPQDHPQAIEQARRLWQGDVPQRPGQDVLIDESQRIVDDEQLVDRVLVGLSHMLQEADDLGRTQLARMALVVEEDVAQRPADAAFGGRGRAVVRQSGVANEVEKPRGLRFRCRGHDALLVRPGPVQIRDFNGSYGGARVQGSGISTEVNGAHRTYFWDADLRFMQGVYRGKDGNFYTGTFVEV